MTDLVLLFPNDAVDIIMGMYALHTWKKSLILNSKRMHRKRI